MKALLALVAVLAAIAVSASAALADTGFTTDTLAPGGYGPDRTPFVTDTLAPGPPAQVVTAPAAFSWPDAGVGAGVVVGAALVLAGGALAVSRRRGRLAV